MDSLTRSRLRLEQREVPAVRERGPGDLDGLADRHVARRAAHDIGEQADPLVEIDQRHRVGLAPGDSRVGRAGLDRDGGDDAVARRGAPFQGRAEA